MKPFEVQEALYRGEFQRVDSLIDQLRNHNPIIEVDSRWFVLGGLSRYFQGDFSGAIEDLYLALENDSNNVGALNVLAYILACCPEGRYHDGCTAVKMATHACQLTNWQDWVKILNLAAAYARLTKFDLATKYVDLATHLATESGLVRCKRLRELIEKKQASTGDIEEDFRRWVVEECSRHTTNPGQ